MRLIIVRHGNTFESSQQPVWVGATEDPPLTVEGRKQAQRLGVALAAQFRDAKAIFFGPLRRTSETATVIAESFPEDLPLFRAAALREINYGQWAGLSEAEIRSRFGNTELDAWQSGSQWPSNGVWGSDPDELQRDLSSFVLRTTRYANDGDLIAVTSGGIARELLRNVGALQRIMASRGSPKLATGSYGVIRIEGKDSEITAWGVRPS